MKTCTELDISQLAKLTGMPASKLRYYEEKGLVKSIGRDGLKRVFAASAVDQLALVALGQFAGFSLDEIGAMFSSSGEAQIDRPQLLDKAEALAQKIQQLTALRDTILHVAHCPAPNQLECPRFQSLLRLAARTQVRHSAQ